jgi:hypothetical protein
MSIRRSTTRRTVVAGVLALATSTALMWGGTAAAADPPALNDPCAQLLARAAEWPGDYSDGSRHVSDAYLSYLLRQPVCTPTA